MYGYEATHGYGYLFVTGGGGSADDSITHDKKWLLLFQNGFEQSSCAENHVSRHAKMSLSRVR